MFIVKFSQENYHSGDNAFLLFNFCGQKMNKNIHSCLLNCFNFLMIIVTDSKINWDYYCLYLMIIHAFCEMLSHFF